MRYCCLIHTIICLLLTTHIVRAQDTFLIKDTLSISSQKEVTLSKGLIVPGTAKLSNEQGQPIPTSQYTLDHFRGILLPDSLLPYGNYLLTYRIQTFTPDSILTANQAKQTILTKDTLQQLFIFPEETDKKDNFWHSSDIRKTGSITRGIVAGNNRSTAVTSGLRLNLEGELGDGLQIVGNITDENIPVQPDGTTQEISDFDRIFIQLRKNPYYVTMGDFESSQKNTRFGNFYRNVQGVEVGIDHDQHQASLSGAIAKGKFHTNSFIGQEGVSGPYRLRGRNGERFFFVLAGSERVYLNGKLLKRGATNDYIIDYNRAEVSFTAKHVISSASRIVVDFEYNDRYYNRSFLSGKWRYQSANEKWKVQVSYAREADNPNAPFSDTDAFSEVKDTLEQVGDNTDRATTSAIRQVGYDPDQIRYARVDTIVNGVAFERYIFSNEPISATYEISFSFVGEGQGHYVRIHDGFNQAVYEWVGPDENGQLQGDYEPSRQWVLPRLLQVMNAKASYQLTPNMQLYTEQSVSHDDNNRLSLLDDQDNWGWAQISGIKGEKVPLGKTIKLDWNVSHQMVQKRYRNIDRIYQAEYNRIWALDTTTLLTNEHITDVQLGLQLGEFIRVESQNGWRSVGQGQKAFRQVYTVKSSHSKSLEGHFSFTRIENKQSSLNRSIDWKRYEGDIFRYLGPLKLGTQIWIEDRRDERGDTLSQQTFTFTDLKPYLSFESKKLQYEVSYNYRWEEGTALNTLRPKSEAHTFYTTTRWQPLKGWNISQNTSYRKFRVQDSLFKSQNLQDANIFTGRLMSNWRVPNNLFQGNLLYELTSEQVSRREVRYLEVNTGQGQYIWEDFNENGIQELDEFQISVNPLIANYVRVSLPSRQLFPSTRVSLSGNIKWNFQALKLKKKNLFNTILKETRLITRFRLTQQQERENALSNYLISLNTLEDDTTVIQANQFFRQDVIFFQNDAFGDIRLFYQNQQSKLFLESGNEFRKVSFIGIKPRINFDRNKSLEVESSLGRRISKADSFRNRSFNIQFWEMKPYMNFQFSQKLRLSIGYEFKHKENLNKNESELTRIQLHKVVSELRWNLKERNTLFASLNLIQVNEIGEIQANTAYELREGLQKGRNVVGQMVFSVFLKKNLELNLSYDGRISEVQAVIHSGKIQLRAYF
ncbi:MAG: hypothetical protein AAF824_01015 [Bacteroidota bacterium]